MTTETEINTSMSTLAAQRNAALDVVALQTGQLAELQLKVKNLEAEVSSLKHQLSEVR